MRRNPPPSAVSVGSVPPSRAIELLAWFGSAAEDAPYSNARSAAGRFVVMDQAPSR